MNVTTLLEKVLLDYIAKNPDVVEKLIEKLVTQLLNSALKQ